ncbi:MULTISPECIES: hypothetical protein [unclassified Streptomyces]|uniref:hypothetical protein n=1 Tax=unclassified Streptomyces TaxID=2593676 RepID=UPI00037A32F9|nr:MULTISPECIES: hypothetical protein [unclassified Streptomyces]MYS36715.1 hypothetical protein [Streptomyces sp. SID4920]MYX69186.1 hypothetical protein [Streptomyces sp. SID8373]
MLLRAAHQWELLDGNGCVSAAPSYTELLQHAVDAHDLSRDVLRLTGDFAESPYRTTRAGSAVLVHLATASSLSVHAAPRFANTAEGALSVLRFAGPIDHHLANRMVIDHAVARSFLRRASKPLRDAAMELDGHLDFHRFLAKLTPRNSTVLPPSRPVGRHR